MILVSKSRDYYDFCCNQFRDEKVVFKRECNQVVEAPSDCQKLGLLYYKFEEKNLTIEYTKNVLVFCGKPFFFIKKDNAFSSIRHYRQSDEFIYEHNKPKKYKEALKEIEDSYKKRLLYLYHNRDQYTDKTFEDLTKELDCHYFLVEKHCLGRLIRVIKYPILKDICFPLHPTEVYQTLMGNMQAQDPDIVEVSDKIKLTQHGFNDTSFKTRKGTKPNRKRNHE